MKTIFYLTDDNGKLWVEVIISTFLNPVATLDFFPVQYNDRDIDLVKNEL